MGRAGQDRLKSEIHGPQRSSSARATAPRSLARLFHHPAVDYRCDAPRPRRGAAVILPPMTANPLDLRSRLGEIPELGGVKEVLGADWDLELGAVSERHGK